MSQDDWPECNIKICDNCSSNKTCVSATMKKYISLAPLPEEISNCVDRICDDEHKLRMSMSKNDRVVYDTKRQEALNVLWYGSK